MSPFGRSKGANTAVRSMELASMGPQGRAKGAARSAPYGTPPISAKPSLQLSLQFADPSHRAHLPRHRVQRWLRAALQAPAELTVRIVGAEEGQALNASYRQKDYATNVLTFDYERQPVVVADLVLCAPVVAAEAQAEGKSIEAHYAHLLVHGALHAQGYDHERVADARVMEALESELLLALGFADPYWRAARRSTPKA
jgi:probable rRNA maturation factor